MSVTLQYARKIRRLVHSGSSVRQVADQLKLPYMVVYNVATGRTWKELTDPPPVARLPRRRRKQQACVVCGQMYMPKNTAKGRCSRCYVYWQRNKRERPVDLVSGCALSAQEIADLGRRYEAGESLRVLAGDAGCDKQTLRHKLVQAGYRIRLASEQRLLNAKMVIRIRADFYENGVALPDLVRKYRLKRRTLYAAVMGHSWPHVPGIPLERCPGPAYCTRCGLNLGKHLGPLCFYCLEETRGGCDEK
ncbi:MAG: hypothetical protein KJ063_02310 [Anaerolineae bacterium]|nr:hypothetical protein [Anaerolineae bacterium]